MNRYRNALLFSLVTLFGCAACVASPVTSEKSKEVVAILGTGGEEFSADRPVVDADNLADIPVTQGEPEPCPE